MSSRPMEPLSDCASLKNSTCVVNMVPTVNISPSFESSSNKNPTESSLPEKCQFQDNVSRLQSTEPSHSSKSNQISSGSSDDISGGQSNCINKGTNTDKREDKRPKCKYCLIRLAKLRELERKRPVKSSWRTASSEISPSHTYVNASNCVRVDRGCQTSAALFEQASMTQRETRCFMTLLRDRNGKPLRTETYCSCVLRGCEEKCICGEDAEIFEWLWDANNRGASSHVQQEGRVVMFHKDYSCGTAAICGDQLMQRDQYFWEIKMTTPVYGTDMMVGVGTTGVELDRYSNEFSSMLGTDGDSWGFSYDGRVQHNGRKTEFCGRFGQGAIIGMHLDMWHGTLALFKNRRSLGVAFKGLRGKPLYPMACSTAARSAMKIISSRSFPSSLQYLCCRKLRSFVPSHLSVLDVLPMPPGLRVVLANNLDWLLQVPPQPRLSLQTSSNPSSSPSSGYICNICLPLKNVFEGYTDDEGESSDGDRVYNGFNLIDSEDEEDSEESDAEESFGSALRTSYGRLVQSLRTHSTPTLPYGASSTRPTSPKRPRLDVSLTLSTEDEEEDRNSESEDSILEQNGDAPSFDRRESMEEDSSSPRKNKFGKRKRTQR